MTYTVNRVSGPTGPGTACANITSLECIDGGATLDGTYSYTVTATDSGSRTATSGSIQVVVDTGAPTGAFVPGSPGGVVSPPLLPQAYQLQLAATASDAGSGVASVRFRYLAPGAGSWATAASVNTPSGITYFGQWDLTGLPDGIYTIGIVVTDKAGNQFGSNGNPAAQRPLVLDGTPPTGPMEVGFSDIPGSWVRARDAAVVKHRNRCDVGREPRELPDLQRRRGHVADGANRSGSIRWDGTAVGGQLGYDQQGRRPLPGTRPDHRRCRKRRDNLRSERPHRQHEARWRRP